MEAMDNPKVVSINRSLNFIKKFFEDNPLEVDQFIVKMKDIIFFYGLTPDIYLKILEEGRVPYSYPQSKLSNLEGINNAMVFRIKYRKEEYLNPEEKITNISSANQIE